MLPWNLAVMSEEEVLAKAFCISAVITTPGMRKAT